MKPTPSPQSQPRTLRYRGDQQVLIEKDPHGFGPDAFVCFDFDGDGYFEREVRTDAEGPYAVYARGGRQGEKRGTSPCMPSRKSLLTRPVKFRSTGCRSKRCPARTSRRKRASAPPLA